jgi:hypothetical protein
LAWISFRRALSATLKVPVFTGMLCMSVGVYADEYPALNNEQIDWVGSQIFNNECKRLTACLTAWNEGESFPSLGLGHFIWYQAGQEEIFEESFPALLAFLRNEGVTIPAWIEEAKLESPWPDRTAFQSEFESRRMSELRTFLHQHTREQTAFIIKRFNGALEQILTSVTAENSSGLSETEAKARLNENFFMVANSNLPYGLYALIDYVNFKGTGTSDLESYQGQGWGLKQVLLGMNTSQPPLQGFVDSARNVLATRVQNAPVERIESRWLDGWNNRLNTYTP